MKMTQMETLACVIKSAERRERRVLSIPECIQLVMRQMNLTEERATDLVQVYVIRGRKA